MTGAHWGRSFEPSRLAFLELRMWKAYYRRQGLRLFGLLVLANREQAGAGWARAVVAAAWLARGAARFGRSTGDYDRFLPDIVRGYRALGIPDGVDASEVARRELRWWVVRREIGLSAGQAAGEAIAALYATLYGLPPAAVEEAGRLRGLAAEVRDRGATADPDGPAGPGRAYWPEVARLLDASYRSLRAALDAPPPGVPEAVHVNAPIEGGTTGAHGPPSGRHRQTRARGGVMHAYHLQPSGPFSLANERQFFGDWLSQASDPDAVVMTFPVEGWRGSAAVVVRQAADGNVAGTVTTTGAAAPDRAWAQALASLSLDADGAGFPDVGARDPVIGRLQARYAWLRPVCFHSPYEAAVNFVVGQRISMRQARAIRARMASELGEPLEVDGQTYHAFPVPERLIDLGAFPGLPDEKLGRLRGVAQAAEEGRLDRARLRTMTPSEALADLQRLRGVGPFAAQGILHRGAGLVDDVTDDEVTRQAVQAAYSLPDPPTQAEVLAIAEAWRPFRMWTTVLLHVALRREHGGPMRARHRS